MGLGPLRFVHLVTTYVCVECSREARQGLEALALEELEFCWEEKAKGEMSDVS